ncbi:MAG: hypothetical protein HeimC3_37570 [Candidatus Heimdallarchaeota archaeon LC_3]|nr:MAG: hypothetical protein HeimC3_37570 [Candidatus Heimdallarchaeota archaeon LC_3]
MFLMKIPLVGDDEDGIKTIFEKFLGEKRMEPHHFFVQGFRGSIKKMIVANKDVKFQFWFLNQAKRFISSRRLYYQGSYGFIVFSDVTNRNSFLNSNKIFNEVLKNCRGGPIPVVLIGTKSDLRDSSPDSISLEEAQRYAKNCLKHCNLIVKSPILTRLLKLV